MGRRRKTQFSCENIWERYGNCNDSNISRIWCGNTLEFFIKFQQKLQFVYSKRKDSIKLSKCSKFDEKKFGLGYEATNE